MSEYYYCAFKILTLGESGVGKTSILLQFAENKFPKLHLATLGIDFRSKIIHVSDKDIKLKISDSAGQERFHVITRAMFKDANGIALIYDVTDKNSCSKIKYWIEQIKSNISEKDISLVLLGNKCDMKEREVSQQQGKEMAQELNISYFETSAKTGKGINEAFEHLAKEIMKKKGDVVSDRRKSFRLTSSTQRKNNKKGCCYSYSNKIE